ncbi:NRDE family protein [Pseudomonas typographi]|uniref:Uncharacterized protein n=1 Tax=Pseudomonas typographi TaxID=2715964 RepID=A0ABR7YZ71_9PSED|nr:NRDE family protein [Pseudomonas typographi]MBD1549978.1 hypothetical protein [Pseudomonas typographi]MBD1585360.1 hypothetical protein [Pseudomonas typographi]MBD1598526.1 hypothetical protein [Pseudomonas typographi]
MCLIVFAWRPGHHLPLLVAGNRDEFYGRPSAALAAWPQVAGVYAGRDLEAGGTWLGIGPHGRFAAVTNIRAAGQPRAPRSRGELVAGFLTASQPLAAYAQQVMQRAAEYAGFNLLLGDGQQLCHLASHSAPRLLPEGVYGLSNAGLDTPWPKVLRARSALQAALPDAQPPALFELLADDQPPPDDALPDTGVGLATERLLATAFIKSADYGTRASTLLYAYANGERVLLERSFGPFGEAAGEVRIRAFSEPAG